MKIEIGIAGFIGVWPWIHVSPDRKFAAIGWLGRVMYVHL